jgi:hypothetical protein
VTTRFSSFQQHKNQRLQDLADKIGLDSIVMCDSEDEGFGFTVQEDLNLTAVNKEEYTLCEQPWYEQLKA